MAPSSIEELKNAIKADNPFDRPLFVKQEDIWGRGFPDVLSLNAHASDAIFEAIEKVRIGKRSTIGITVTAERGLGKSHVISRVRHRLQMDGAALFVYMSEYSNLDQINREFLQTLAQSLRRTGSQEVMQWQEVATALLSEVFKKEFQPKQMVDVVFPNQIAKFLAEGKKPVDLVDKLRDSILKIKQDIEDPYLVQALIWTLSKPYAMFATTWLAGKSLAQTQAEAMGLPASSNEDEETESLHIARRILNLIGHYKTVVICFDELDGVGVNQQGFTRAMVVSGLGKDIANDFKRGVLLTAMYPITFKDEVKTMPAAEAVVDRIAEKVVDLKPLNPDNVVALVTEWLRDFYNERGLIPPYPTYPFEETRLRDIGEERPIVRQVLKWCAENFKISEESNVSVPKKSKVEIAFEKELADLEWAIDDYLEDKDTLSNALKLGFQSLIGTNKLVERVEIIAVEEIDAKGSDKGHINFKIVGRELINVRKLTVKIGVSVVQQSNGRAIASTLQRLKDYEKFDLTRGCLVRSKSINPTAKQAFDFLKELLQNKGEWVLLMAEHVKPLLALLFIRNHIDDYELTEKEIFDFADQTNLVSENPLIREILSKPTGKIPQDALNEELAPTVPSLPNIPDLDNIPDLEVELG
ncbi:MAG TPA: P-loop NTPase fold protein [Cyanophyceae cyanobacterium]